MLKRDHRFLSGLSRRHLLGGAAALAGLSVAPRLAQARPSERKFLFFYAGGGWDTTTVLDPHFGSSGVDMDPDTYMGGNGILNYTAGPDRPLVGRFFERWGNRTAIVNGIDAHSVGHDSAMQFVMTGTSASSYADWPTIIAANSTLEYPMPHVVFSGPSYPGTSASAVVRAGGGTLLELLDGSILGKSDSPTPRFSEPSDAMIDAFVYDRVGRFAAQQRGNGAERGESLRANLERAMELEGRRFEAGLSDLGRSMVEQGVKAAELFRLGLSRCAMIGIDGGFDTHGDERQQILNQDPFFGALDEIMDHLSSTPGHTTRYLIDEVVIVALSEFGRTPKFNGSGGKDHWPYGSALVVGSGVAGGQSLGVTDDKLIAKPIDMSTGREKSDGDMLACEHLGTALLKLGGLDPAYFLPGVQSLDALLG